MQDWKEKGMTEVVIPPCFFFLFIILTPTEFSFCTNVIPVSCFLPVPVLTACLCCLHRFIFSTWMSHSKGRWLLSCKICVSLSSVWQSRHLHGPVTLGHIAKLSPELRNEQRENDLEMYKWKETLCGNHSCERNVEQILTLTPKINK